MAIVRSLFVISCIAMIPVARSNISNSFDERYLRVKRAQGAPWELTFNVPCKSCILTAKLGMDLTRHIPNGAHLNALHEDNLFPMQSKSIPLNKVFKRRLQFKRQVPPSPRLLHEIDSLDNYGRYYAKYPSKKLKLISRPRRQHKKEKRIRYTQTLIPRRRRKGKVTRSPKSVFTRKSRSTGKSSLPRVTNIMVVTKRPKVVTFGITEIATTRSVTTLVERLNIQGKLPQASLIEQETASLPLEKLNQMLTTPSTSDPANDTTTVEDPTQMSESFERTATTKEVIKTTPITPNILRDTYQEPQTNISAVSFVDTTQMLMQTTPFTLDSPTESTTGKTKIFSTMELSAEEYKIPVPKVLTSLSLNPREEITLASITGLGTTGLFSEIPSLTTVPTLHNLTDTKIGGFITNLPRFFPRIAATDEYKRITPILPGAFTEKVPLSQQAFAQALDQFERRFYNATFGKLSSISPPDRRENGISFVQSGLFLYSILTALRLEVDLETKQELEMILDLDISTSEKLNIMRHILHSLPESGTDLKLRWSTRLLVNGSWTPATDALDEMRIQVERIKCTATPEQLMKSLNHKVEEDSGGAMRNTFEEDELSNGVSGILLNTLYLRARWRSAPTLLNGTRQFRDAPGAPLRTARMIRINDVMRYAFLPEWSAEAVEISYSTPGLSLLLLVPRGQSLRGLSEVVSAVSLSTITARMRNIRVAATLPIYTLRMTLLLPNKLQAMGISRLIDGNATKAGDVRLSHAVQRIMFWAEAGRNAFKDDGIEWDETPQLELMVDRPYLFYVRWRNVTIMNGNFVL